MFMRTLYTPCARSIHFVDLADSIRFVAIRLHFDFMTTTGGSVSAVIEMGFAA